MNSKSRIIIVILVVLIGIGIYLLYNTFAINSSISNNDNIYAISLDDDTSINIPGNSSKTIVYHINNANSGRVKYGIEYKGNNIDVKVYNNSIDKASDYIDTMGNKYVKLYIVNRGNTSSVVNLKTVLGYENGGDLILDDGYSLVSKIYIAPFKLSSYISSLYDNSIKSSVINNGISYKYDISDNLMNDNNGNIRYYGSSPNNYIYFNCDKYPSTNCELWRIVGLFYIEDKEYIKIIRNSKIGDYSWDTSASSVNLGHGINEWSSSDLMKLLNSGYDIESIGGSLYYNSKSGTCYNDSSDGTTACDFTSSGIKNSTRNLIEEVNWNTGGYNVASIYANQAYTYERGTTVVLNPRDGVKRTTSWKGKIAVPYPSDYGFATDFNKCDLNLYSFNDECKNSDWLYPIVTNSGKNFGWLLPTYSSYTDYSWYVNSTGIVDYGHRVYRGYGVVPTLYLSSDTYVVDSDGSSSNPFMLKVK